MVYSVPEDSDYASPAGSELGKNESDSLESMHMVSIKIEYYRSLEYSVKWENLMNPKRTSKRLKSSKHRDSQSSGEESIQRKVKGQRQQKGCKKGKSVDKGVSADEQRTSDLIDIIDCDHQGENDGSFLAEVPDEGVEQAEDDEVSDTSVASGPTLPHNLSAEPRILCSACCKLYQKAKRIKAPLKDKLLDTNHKSLTCDQWVLLKPWRRKDIPYRTGPLVHNLPVFKRGRKKSELAAKEGQLCSRWHIFLQRNLRRHLKMPQKKEKKKKNRKRSREDSLDPRVAKQQRLHNNHRPISSSFTEDNNSLHSAMSSACSRSSLEDLTCAVNPMSVCLDSDKIKDFTKQNVTKKLGGFNALLAQMRGNNSMIVRESGN